MNTKTLIIGAGPSGLSCASKISETSTEYIVIDKGKNLTDRIHNQVSDIAKGVGGLGLFSDGKFSFFPSGSNVYSLHEHYVEKAYVKLKIELESIGVQAPALELEKARTTNNKLFNGKKEYRSIYVNLHHRKLLVKNQLEKLNRNVVPNTKANKINKTNDGYITECINSDGEIVFIKSRHIVISTGKYGFLGALPDSILSFCDFSVKEGRFEFGIRIETNPKASFFNKNAENDIKYTGVFT